MTTEERAAWLEARRAGIGGSDCAAALGLSPYQTPYELWLEKRGDVTPPNLDDNQYVEWGNRLEDVVADAYADKTGNKVHRVNRILKHPAHPFMLANLDRRVVGDRRGLEVKTANAWVARDEEQWGETGTDQVPVHYLLQTQHYMAVTGYEAFDLAVLMGGNDFRIYTIPRQQELIETIIEREAAFWQLVQNGTAPSAQTISDTRKKFPRQLAGTYIEADDATAKLVAEYREIDAQIKEAKKLDKRREELQAQIGDYMGANDTLTVNGDDALTFRHQSTGKRIPATFKDSEPEIYAQYAVEGFTRVMRIVKAKK